MNIETLPLPEVCLTLLPPWTQAIAFAEKRLENRSFGVGRALANWRYSLGVQNVPVIGLSQSKSGVSADRTKVDEEVIEQAKEIGRIHKWDIAPIDGKITLKMLKVGEWAGKLCLAAELLDVLPPDRCKGDPWHVQGQWGLILGRVWLVEPMPCSGGRGMWASQWCAACGHVQADSQGDRCRGCKEHGTLRGTGKRPVLQVERECGG